MRTTAIILFIILGIWSIFSFETSRIFLAFKYYWSNILVFPIRTISITIIALVISSVLVIIVNKGIVNPIRLQQQKIENIKHEFEIRNIKIDFNSEMMLSYLKIHDKLKSNGTSSIENEILNFIDNSRFFYNNLPAIFENNPEFNKQVFNMINPTQVVAIKIKRYKHTILFISHNKNFPDKRIKILSYEDLPSNLELHKILDSIFTDLILNTLKENFENWHKYNIGLHGSAGVAVATNPNLSGGWMWIGVPDPFNNENNLNNLLAENIYLYKI
jgi:hypothetical protein